MSKVGKVMKKELLDNLLGPKCGKSLLFSKARVSVRVRLRVRVSYSSCENGHFRWTRWCGKVMKKEFLDNVLGPKLGKSRLFSKARVSVRVRVSYSSCENGHFRSTRWCPRLGK